MPRATTRTVRRMGTTSLGVEAGDVFSRVTTGADRIERANPAGGSSLRRRPVVARPDQQPVARVELDAADGAFARERELLLASVEHHRVHAAAGGGVERDLELEAVRLARLDLPNGHASARRL